MLKIEAVQWDSNFFEMRIGRILIHTDVDFDPEDFKIQASNNFDLVYVFCLDKMLSQSNVLLAQLDLVDIMMTVSMPFIKEQHINNIYQLRVDLSKEELHRCYAIAENTSTVSRFFSEEKVGPHKTKLLYRKWIDNAVQKSFSDGLFLAKENNSVIGINLVKVDEENKEAVITLIGVDPNYKRLGLGKKLWEQAFGYFANETEINKVKTSFSLINKDSFNFHLKIGLNKIEEIKYIYHFRTK